MAFNKKAPPKEEEKSKPTYIVRCKQSSDSDFWTTIGAAWDADINGKKGFSVRLHSTPIDWDGTFLMMPPLPDKE